MHLGRSNREGMEGRRGESYRKAESSQAGPGALPRAQSHTPAPLPLESFVAHRAPGCAHWSLQGWGIVSSGLNIALVLPINLKNAPKDQTVSKQQNIKLQKLQKSNIQGKTHSVWPQWNATSLQVAEKQQSEETKISTATSQS